MTARNDVTGDLISTKSNSKEFCDGWDRIFGKKEVKVEETEVTTEVESTEASKE